MAWPDHSLAKPARLNLDMWVNYKKIFISLTRIGPGVALAWPFRGPGMAWATPACQLHQKMWDLLGDNMAANLNRPFQEKGSFF